MEALKNYILDFYKTHDKYIQIYHIHSRSQIKYFNPFSVYNKFIRSKNIKISKLHERQFAKLLHRIFTFPALPGLPPMLAYTPLKRGLRLGRSIIIPI